MIPNPFVAAVTALCCKEIAMGSAKPPYTWKGGREGGKE